MDNLIKTLSIIMLTLFLIYQWGEIKVLKEKVEWLEQQQLDRKDK